jgi:AI-2 transport protein TqsA
LVPFLLAIFFTHCLTPVIDFQVRHLRAPRLLAIPGAVILGLAILGACGLLITVSVAEMAENYDAYRADFIAFASYSAQTLRLEQLGIHFDPETGRFHAISDQSIKNMLSSMLVEGLDLVSSGMLVVIFMVFILLGKKGDLPRPPGLLDDIEQSIRRYTLTMVALSVLTGVLVWFPLFLLHVPFAYLFGFLAFLLNFIPNVGSIVATLLPVPVILLSPDLTITAKVLALSLPAAIQVVLATLVQPRVLGRSLDLHPVVVLMALIFFGMIWGISGAFLAAPITAVIKIILERIPTARPLAALLAGDLQVFSRPASTFNREPPTNVDDASRPRSPEARG